MCSLKSKSFLKDKISFRSGLNSHLIFLKKGHLVPNIGPHILVLKGCISRQYQDIWRKFEYPILFNLLCRLSNNHLTCLNISNDTDIDKKPKGNRTNYSPEIHNAYFPSEPLETSSPNSQKKVTTTQRWGGQIGGNMIP